MAITPVARRQLRPGACDAIFVIEAVKNKLFYFLLAFKVMEDEQLKHVFEASKVGQFSFRQPAQSAKA